MPEFRDGEEERERRKLERLAPHLGAAMARKQARAGLADDAIPVFPAYGRTILETDDKSGGARARARKADG
jgi:hypothetical protein